jgi:hypothetical protein
VRGMIVIKYIGGLLILVFNAKRFDFVLEDLCVVVRPQLVLTVTFRRQIIHELVEIFSYRMVGPTDPISG